MKTAVESIREMDTFIRTYDAALDGELCARMIQSFERLTHLQARNGRDVMPQLPASAWTELNISKVDASLEAYFHNQVMHYLDRYNKDINLTLPIPPRNRFEDLRIKRYNVVDGDQFQPHFDAKDYSSNRYLVFLWYLNDVAEGGETEFCDLGVRIRAQTGRLLVFPPYWMFQHAGLPPRSNDKYIISTYLLF